MSDQAMIRAYYYVLHCFRECISLSKVGGKRQVKGLGVIMPRLCFFILQKTISRIV